MTVNASDNTLLDITAGTGIFIDNTTDDMRTESKTVGLPGFTGIKPTSTSGASFVTYKLDGNGDPEIVFNPAPIFGEDLRDNVYIGVAIHNFEQPITNIDTITLVSGISTGAEWADFTLAALGITQQESGRANRVLGRGDLKISKRGGTFFFNAIEARNNLKSPNLLSTDTLPFGAPIFQGWTTTDGDGDNTALVLTGEVFTSGIYDDGTAVQADSEPQGVLNDDEWVNHRIWFLLAFGLFTMQYGQTKYGNSHQARQAISSEGFDNIPAFNGSTPIATITCRGGASVLDDDFHGFITQATRLGDHRT